MERDRIEFAVAQSEARNAKRAPTRLPPVKSIEKVHQLPSHLKPCKRNQSGSKMSAPKESVAPTVAPAASSSAAPIPGSTVSLVDYDDSSNSEADQER